MSPRLRPDALRGVRIGVMRFSAGFGTDAPFEAALDDAARAGRRAGRDPEFPGRQEIGRNEIAVLLAELKHDLNAYLATLPAAVGTRTLAQLIAFNRAHPPSEMPLFGQDLFEQAQATRGPRRGLSHRARDLAAPRRARRGSTGCCASTMSSPWSRRPGPRPG